MSLAGLVLASGRSERFGRQDKLLAMLNGKPLLAHCLENVQGAGFDDVFMVCPDPDPRADLARRLGFKVIPNPDPQTGQGASIALGASFLLAKGYDSVCIILGDMPFISSRYFKEIQETPGDIVFSRANDKDQPPAIFRGNALRALTQLSKDRGAKSLDLSSFEITLMDLPPEMSVDFDTEEDFKAV